MLRPKTTSTVVSMNVFLPGAAWNSLTKDRKLKLLFLLWRWNEIHGGCRKGYSHHGRFPPGNVLNIFLPWVTSLARVFIVNHTAESESIARWAQDVHRQAAVLLATQAGWALPPHPQLPHATAAALPAAALLPQAHRSPSSLLGLRRSVLACAWATPLHDGCFLQQR